MLLTGMGATAVLLAILGIYGVLSYVVAQRTRDIGIRVSLGGTAWEILRTVVGDVVALASVGVVVGLVLAQSTGPAVRSALVGEVPTGPWILVGVSALVLATVLAASLAPALRALQVDPLVAFRADQGVMANDGLPARLRAQTFPPLSPPPSTPRWGERAEPGGSARCTPPTRRGA